MSTGPQGPGWWRASDGRWYPPQARPAPVPPRPPVRAGRGFPTALVVVAIVLVVVGGGAIIAVNVLLNRVGDAIGGGSCEFVDDGDASATLGGEFEFIELSGVTGMVKVAADVRPLPDGETCLGQGRDAASDRIVSVTRLRTPDAQARFEQERTAANGTSEDNGDGITVQTPGYFNKDVPAGDQAFCTTADLTSSSGVFVRRGDVLLYVAVTAAGIAGGQAPSLAPSDPAKFASDDENCELAQRLLDGIG